ncbi:hypothetical protein LTR28_004890, partial [Elasticomyces elasticus]
FADSEDKPTAEEQTPPEEDVPQDDDQGQEQDVYACDLKFYRPIVPLCSREAFAQERDDLSVITWEVCGLAVLHNRFGVSLNNVNYGAVTEVLERVDVGVHQPYGPGLPTRYRGFHGPRRSEASDQTTYEVEDDFVEALLPRPISLRPVTSTS